VSYSIIEQHHGDLAVRSVLGEGTTFRIALPVAQ
jgi:two-component system NtrC family sensor kinase